MAKGQLSPSDPPGRVWDPMLNHAEELGKDDYVPVSWVLKILADFKAIDCHSCQKHVGYQHRQDQNLFFCSDSNCLQKSIERVEKILKPETGSAARISSDCSSVSLTKQCGNPMKTSQLEKSRDEMKSGIVQLGEFYAKKKQRVVRKKASKTESNHVSRSSDDSPEDEKQSLRKSLKGLNSPFRMEKSKPVPMNGADIPAKTSRRLGTDIMAEAAWASPFLKTTPHSSPESKRLMFGDEVDKKKSDIMGKPSTSSNHHFDNTSEMSPPILPSIDSRKDRKIWRLQDLKLSRNLKDRCRATVTFVWSPELFTITAKADQEKLNELQLAIAVHCKTEQGLSRTPEKGDIIFAPYGGEFYRAVVEVVLWGKQKAQVHFLDFGDRAIVSLPLCKDVSDDIMTDHPVYGVRFQCSGKIPVPKDFHLPQEMKAAIEEDVVIEIDKKEEWKWHGQVHVDGFGSWNEMLEKRIAQFLQIEGLELDEVPRGSEPAPEKTLRLPEVSTPKQKPSEAPAEPLRKTIEVPSSVTNATFLDDCQVSPTLQHGSLVRITFMWAYNKLTLTAVDDLPKVKELQSLIRTHVKTAPEMKRTPKPREVVIAPYDEYYGRAVIESVASNTVRVRYVDVGDEKDVDINALRELNAEIKAHPLYSILFVLKEVPEKMPHIDIPELEICMESKCQIELVSKKGDTWNGYLWVARDQTWNDIVLAALKSKAHHRV